MDVLIVEPEKRPYMAIIAGDLESLQKVVGGYIEAVYPYDDPVAIVCNEEGKMNGLQLNRKIEDYDIIAGTFMICGLGEEDFASLSPELAEKYQEKFKDPAVFMRVGSRIVAIPFTPKDEPELATVKSKSHDHCLSPAIGKEETRCRKRWKAEPLRWQSIPRK